MNRLTRSLALVLACSAATMATAGAAMEPVRAETIHLYNGEVKTLPVDGVRRVAVGNGKLLSVTNLPRQLILIGTGVGDTNLLIWNRRGRVSAYNIDIGAQDSTQMAADLRDALGGIEGLQVDARGGQVVLSGDITPADEKQVAKVVRNLRGGVINLTHAVTVDMKRMIYLDVQVVDFKKSVLRNLGINWQQAIAGPALGVVGNTVSNPYYRIGDLTQGGQLSNELQGPHGPLTGLPTDMPFSRYLGITTSLSSVINLAVQNGDAYIMANPQLSTRSGGDATFLAGGEVPIPVSSSLGQTTVNYKNYGVQLNIKPLADRFGNIEASVDTEVSQIDPSVVINGYPGFLTRKTTSMVNVHSGQTIVMSGLVQATGSNTVTKFPWLGDVPILGALFRDKNFQSDRDELVIFVTPVVFNPDSRLNHEVVGRGAHIARQFNDSEMGKPVWMPGFGVGPISHLPRPKGTGPESKDGPRVMGGTGVPAAPASAANPPATATQPPPAPAPNPLPSATTRPLPSAPPAQPAPATSSGGGMAAALPLRVDVSRLAVQHPARRLAPRADHLAVARAILRRPAPHPGALPVVGALKIHESRLVAALQVSVPAVDSRRSLRLSLPTVEQRYPLWIVPAR